MKLHSKLVGLILLFILVVNVNYAQNSINIQVFQPLPQIEFAAFATSNDLSGMPRIFFVEINPKNVTVSFKAVIQWQQDENGGFQELFSFETNPFLSHDFYNDNVGNDIVIKTTSSNSDLVSTNIKLGKPTGNYKIIGTLLDQNGSSIASDIELLEFVNPAQTLTILSPESKSFQDAFSVMASWTEINGAASYTVLANVRKDKSESLEESLRAGTLYINRNVGLSTVVNLRNIIDREWLPGDEIVLEVIADIPGPNGGQKIESDIINFYLNNFTPADEINIEKKFSDIATAIGEQVGSDFWNKLSEGDISVKTILKPDGTPMSAEEITRLLNFIKQNPDLVISMKKIK